MKKSKKNKKIGFVSLVGGGPGDPGLLTLKGKERLAQSEVVVYDALVHPDLLNHCPPGAKMIFVGKRSKRHAAEQEEIHRLLLKHAKSGKRICRLKGGDPYMFGRGGEEAEFLSHHKINFEVIPGVSSIQAVPASAGIPLTHRDLASFVTIATGHESGDPASPEKGRSKLQTTEWASYSSKKTLVILMGFARLKVLTRKLIASGWPAKTPAALICSGTLPNQFTVKGTLVDLPSKATRYEARLSSPAMIVVGNVVRSAKANG
jgi:uroporphyrinogen III methyltransferase / synthase